MLTKILFTGLVIIVVFLSARIRSNLVARRSALEAAAPANSGSSVMRSRTLAYLVAVGLVASAIGGYFWYWSSWREAVTVRVINTATGENVTYQVHKGSIDDREFQTTDGLRVTLSEADRVEVRQGVSTGE